MGKAMGAVTLAIFAMIGIGIYMGMYTSSNTVGWPSILPQMFGTYFPLLIAVVVLVAIMGAIYVGKKG
jgi:hypothetical protein